MTLSVAPELAQYLDEPKQMASGAPGKKGVLEMSFARRGARSVLARLHRHAPLLVQQALYWDEGFPGLPCVYIITTSGCVLQGDRLDIAIDVAEGAMAHVTTQSATKVHSMDANYAEQNQRFTLADDAYLEYLPGPTIPHRNARFITNTRVTVAPSATLLCSEILMPGRRYHGEGERFDYDVYSSTMTVERPDGVELFTEKFVIAPATHAVSRVGVMNEYDVLGNVILVAPKEHCDRIHELVDSSIDSAGGTMSGVSRLPHDAGLIYKIVGPDRHEVQGKVRGFWEIVRREVKGGPIPDPPLWG